MTCFQEGEAAWARLHSTCRQDASAACEQPAPGAAQQPLLTPVAAEGSPAVIPSWEELASAAAGAGSPHTSQHSAQRAAAGGCSPARQLVEEAGQGTPGGAEGTPSPQAAEQRAALVRTVDRFEVLLRHATSHPLTDALHVRALQYIFQAVLQIVHKAREVLHTLLYMLL